jgi:Fur family ferric uptake transcriptional regulator
MTGDPHTRFGPRRAGKDGQSPSATLCAYIARRGLKRSRQRDRIAETFLAMPGHVSVEEVVERVRRDDPRVSVATVYRTMKLLADCGLAVPRRFGDNHTRYEAAVGRGHHDHLICTVCGGIVEFANEKIESLQETVARRHGFEVESHKLELYGRCARCRRSREAAAR